MQLNMGKFRKLSEDKKSATFQHPDGHKITVAKHVLSQKMRSELSRMPLHLADGTDGKPISDYVSEDAKEEADKASSNAPDTDFPDAKPAQAPVTINIGGAQAQPQPQSPPTPQPSFPVEMHNPELAQQPTPQMVSQADLPTQVAPQNQSPSPETTMPQAPQDPYGANAYMDTYNEGLKNQKEGIQAEANAQGDLAKEQAPLYTQLAKKQQQTANTYQNSYYALEKERQAFQQDVKNNHIDPKHYLNSMGVGQKVATGIGLILGGIGGGLTHQENPALKMLNQQINNDIEAQKVDLGKKENLLSANMRQFGNLRDATDMTRIMSADAIKNQIAAAASKSQDPLVQARAKQAIGAIDMQAAPVLSQMAMRKTLMNQQAQPGAQMDPAGKIRMLGMIGQITPKQQEDAMKELGTSSELMKARDNAISVFDKMNRDNTIMNRTLSPVQTSREVQSARDNIAVQIARDEAGRVNEYEFKAAQNFFPSPGDSAKTLQSKKQDLINALQRKMNTPTLNSLGMGMGAGGSGRYNAQGEKNIKLGPPVAPSEAQSGR